MKPRFTHLITLTLALTGAVGAIGPVNASSATVLTVHNDQPGARINPAMWGIFFEDINFGADGGLYAELVKNRGFEFPDPLMGWQTVRVQLARGEVTVRNEEPFNEKNPHYVRVHSEGTGSFGLSNEGFRGMGLKQGEAYNFSMQIRQAEGQPRLKIQLYGGDGTLLDSTELDNFTPGWVRRTAKLHPAETDGQGRLVLLVEGAGTLDLDFVSLFPEHTWKNRPGGLRADMVQALADLHPGFMRFPGGCVVEGPVLAQRYQWKKTLGPVEERPLAYNRWNSEFLHRPTPDYYQSFGLGFYEYFQLCEDIGAQPLPILNCGMACEFNSGELCSLDQLQPYIQDALDLVEFANGDTNSLWGARRAALGHPAPFGLKLLGVGNEQWGQQYFERYARFAAALKAKYPQVQLVSAAGPDPAGPKFDLAWKNLRELKADLVDEHCYAAPQWFFDNSQRYDHYDRNGPKVFMGEYAAQSVAVCSTKNQNNLECALAEAAYLTGLERNAEVVRMASYAPLFANTEAWQWKPDLIWVDSLNVTRTANYYVQQMFSCNRGDVVLPLEISDLGTNHSIYASAVRDESTGELIVKAVNHGVNPAEIAIRLAGLSDGTKGTVCGQELSATQLNDENLPGQPPTVVPSQWKETLVGNEYNRRLPPNSFTVFRLKGD